MCLCFYMFTCLYVSMYYMYRYMYCIYIYTSKCMYGKMELTKNGNLRLFAANGNGKFCFSWSANDKR